MIGWYRQFRARRAAEKAAAASRAEELARGSIPTGATRGRLYTRPNETPGAIVEIGGKRYARVHIKVTRADGTIEDRGYVDAEVVG